ncbi:ribosomal protein S12 methylthiotransferase accessory factor [Friedmanniella luteola]|uniref:Ribosomal protein S12 methylthiotransferase accessory factor n=1 Tax=Friedmanniella luteola TaxID=546871 RepID=A0A1H1UKN4_9ACTN|nr:YcaO-like family protein [Friedmanniella luteola]SDS73114.1 ribosomal protein S12 methylthiotransferase accessory factor [Friedmanniella luteola]
MPAPNPDLPTSPEAEAYARTLRRSGELVELDLTSLDRLGVPVTSCSVLSEGRVVAHGNGYGRTPSAARRGGLGELAEGVLGALGVEQLRPRARTGSYAELVGAEGAERVADPRTLCLPAGSPWTPEMPLTWLPLRRVRTGEEVLVPVELVASEPGELPPGTTPLLTPVTNGLGAGLDGTRPLAHGLLEILQRHTNGLRFRALDARSPEIAKDSLPASVAALVAELEATGLELVLKHAGTELGVCSTYVMGVDPDPGAAIQVTACGEAADPSAEASLTKAVLEYANSRARKTFMFGPAGRARPLGPAAYWAAVGAAAGGGEARATAAMTAWRDLGVDALRTLTAPDRSRTVRYDDVVTGAPPVTGPEEQLAHLLDQLADHDVLASTVTVDDVCVAKVLVPGLEVETLSYGRVGEVNACRLLEADLDLVRRQDGPSASHPDRVLLTPAAEERLGGPVWYSYAAADRVVGPLYPLYREPARHSVTLPLG